MTTHGKTQSKERNPGLQMPSPVQRPSPHWHSYSSNGRFRSAQSHERAPRAQQRRPPRPGLTVDTQCHGQDWSQHTETTSPPATEQPLLRAPNHPSPSPRPAAMGLVPAQEQASSSPLQPERPRLFWWRAPATPAVILRIILSKNHKSWSESFTRQRVCVRTPCFLNAWT